MAKKLAIGIKQFINLKKIKELAFESTLLIVCIHCRRKKHSALQWQYLLNEAQSHLLSFCKSNSASAVK